MDKTTAAVVSLAGVFLVAGYVVLAALGRPTDAYVVFVTGPLVSAIVGIVLSKKVQRVQDTADTVQDNTNGILSGRLNSLDAQLVAAHRERSAMDGYQGLGTGPARAIDVDAAGAKVEAKHSAREQPTPGDGSDLPVNG